MVPIDRQIEIVSNLLGVEPHRWDEVRPAIREALNNTPSRFSILSDGGLEAPKEIPDHFLGFVWLFEMKENKDGNVVLPFFYNPNLVPSEEDLIRKTRNTMEAHILPRVATILANPNLVGVFTDRSSSR